MVTRIFAPLSVWRTRLAWSKWFLFFLFSSAYAQQAPLPGTISAFAGKTPSVTPGTLATQYPAIPRKVIHDDQGNIYFSDMYRPFVYKINTQQEISVIAGNGIDGFSGDGGAATDAMLEGPAGLAIDKSGNIYISDATAHRIRKVDTQGVITTIAGTGEAGFSGDGGSAALAQLNYPSDLDVDASGNLYIVDLHNHRIRKIDSNGVISTIAGNGTYGYGGDNGNATAAMLKQPSGLDVDTSGNVFIADKLNRRIRKIDTAGVITTVAGGASEWTGEEGILATLAQLSSPEDVFVDTNGRMYIVDGNRVRRVGLQGKINTVVGTILSGFSGDGGQAFSAHLNIVAGLSLSNTEIWSLLIPAITVCAVLMATISLQLLQVAHC